MPEPLRTDDRPRPRALLVGAVVVAVTVAVVVAVLAARSESTSDDVIPQAGVPDSWIDGVLVGVMALGLVALVLIVIDHLRNHERGGGGPTMTNRYLLGAVLLIAIVVALRYLAGEPELPEPDELEEPAGAGIEDEAEETDDESAALWPLLVALGLGAAAVATIPLVRHLTGRPPEDQAAGATRLVERRNLMIGLLDDAIDDLRRHPDPREAVIAAWARLEDAFELAGVERRAADTPLRLLARALETVETSAPSVDGLTRAFERAMFSTHPIDRSTQLGAVDALVAVRDELRLHSRSAAGAT